MKTISSKLNNTKKPKKKKIHFGPAMTEFPAGLFFYLDIELLIEIFIIVILNILTLGNRQRKKDYFTKN